MFMRQQKNKALLTEVELELMTILWKLERATIRDVLNTLTESRQLAYTSTATMMRILEKKKFTKSEIIGKTSFFYPVVSKTEYQQKLIKDISSKLFDNAPLLVVARLIESENISENTLREMRDLLDKKLDFISE